MRKTNVLWTNQPDLSHLFSLESFRIIYQLLFLTSPVSSCLLTPLSIKPKKPIALPISLYQRLVNPDKTLKYTQTPSTMTADQYCPWHCFLLLDQFELV